jgi:curved DNA-binding protein CbpA
MKGSLSNRSAVDVLSEVLRQRSSGILRYQQGPLIRQIFIDTDGLIRFAVSTLPAESMTMLFKQKAGITDEGMRKAAAAKQPNELLGSTLFRLGLIAKEALTVVTQDHIRGTLRAALQMTAGEYEYQPGPLPFREQLDAGMSSAILILEWARDIPDINWIRKRVGSMDGRAQLARRPPAGYDTLPLNPAEGYTMSRVDGSSTTRDICILSPMGEETALRALVGLALAGILDLPQGASDLPLDSRAAPEPAGAPAGRSPAGPAVAAPGRAAPGSATLSAGAKPAPRPAAGQPKAIPASRAPGNGGAPKRPAPTPPRKITSVTDRVRPAVSADLEAEVAERFSKMRDQDLYQVLGVVASTSVDEVRRAYYALARRLHPDKFTKEEMKAKAEKVFGHITEAYSTLSRAESRQKYEEEQALRSGPKHQEKTDTHDLARSNFRAGKDCLDKGKLGEAVSFFQNACEQDPQKAEYFHYLALTQAKNPRWKKDAEGNYLKALEIDPSNGQYYAELGTLYSKGGLHSKAREMFQRALQWDPSNDEAQQGLAAEEGGRKGLLGMFQKKS